MHPTFNVQTAFEAGRNVGIVLSITIPLLAICCIVQAFSKRSIGWIIAGGISALLLLPFLLAVAFGAYVGYERANGVDVTRTPAFRQLLALVGQTITGRPIPYSMFIPNGWTMRRNEKSFDLLASRESMYLAVIAERTPMLGGSFAISKVARDRLLKQGAGVTMTEPATLQLDGKSWVQFTAQCQTAGAPFEYQYYVYSGPEGTFQIMGWTPQNSFEKQAAVLRLVMGTFRFPGSQRSAFAAVF